MVEERLAGSGDAHAEGAQRAKSAISRTVVTGYGISRLMPVMRAAAHVMAHAMILVLLCASLQGAATMHLLAQLHAERCHGLCRQGQHQYPDQGSTQGFAHEVSNQANEENEPDYAR